MDRNNNDKNDCEEKNKIDITGCEIVTLAITLHIKQATTEPTTEAIKAIGMAYKSLLTFVCEV